MMLSIATFVLIYLGVCIAIYQLYDIYCAQSFGDARRLSGIEDEALRDLSRHARQYARTGESAGFAASVDALFGKDLDPRVVLAAFSEGKADLDAAPLLRRRHNIVCNGAISIRHLPFWKTAPPGKSLRGPLLVLIIVNTLLAIFLGGLSVYTIGYEISWPTLAWANSAPLLMLLVYALILVTHLIARLDTYLHDIYRIGQLNAHFPPTLNRL